MEMALKTLRNERGQTTVEWLLLMAMVFLIGYFVITGPMAKATRSAILGVRGSLANVVQNAELKPGALVDPGVRGHPGDPRRLLPVH